MVTDASMISVYLMRHGPAELGEGRPDGERALTHAGVDLVRRVARGLGRLGAAFDLGLCSPLVRAQQTAQLVWQELALDAILTPIPDLAAGACPQAVLRAIREGLAASPTAQSVLVVGHLPDLSQTMFHCIGHAAPRLAPFLPAAVTRLDFTEQLSAGTAALAWMKVPEEIASQDR